MPARPERISRTRGQAQVVLARSPGSLWGAYLRSVYLRCAWRNHLSEPKSVEDTLRLRVTDVTDGDTIKAQAQNGDTVAIRVWGIDAPELPEPYGPAATGVAQQLVGGEVADIEIVDQDQYGRLIGRVQADGTDLAASPALSGYA